MTNVRYDSEIRHSLAEIYSILDHQKEVVRFYYFYDGKLIRKNLASFLDKNERLVVGRDIVAVLKLPTVNAYVKLTVERQDFVTKNTLYALESLLLERVLSDYDIVKTLGTDSPLSSTALADCVTVLNVSLHNHKHNYS